MTSDYPLRFINMVINEFQEGKDHGDKSFIIPSISLESTGLFISRPLAICLASGPGPGPNLYLPPLGQNFYLPTLVCNFYYHSGA